MLTIPKPKRKQKRIRFTPETTQSVAALVLVAAEFDETPRVVLTFDRPIDIAGIVPGAIVVKQAALGAIYNGVGPATLATPTTVVIVLEFTDEYFGPTDTLMASAGNGIVAVDNGGTWAGATELELPFP